MSDRDDYKDILPLNIQYLRRKRGETQQELADQIGIQRYSLVNYERGKSIPRLETLLKLSEHFHTDLNNLVYSNLAKEEVTTPFAQKQIPTTRVQELFEKHIMGSLKIWKDKYYNLEKSIVSLIDKHTKEKNELSHKHSEILDIQKNKLSELKKENQQLSSKISRLEKQKIEIIEELFILKQKDEQVKLRQDEQNVNKGFPSAIAKIYQLETIQEWAILNLNKEEYEIFVLYFNQGKTSVEISTELNISPEKIDSAIIKINNDLGITDIFTN